MFSRWQWLHHSMYLCIWRLARHFAHFVKLFRRPICYLHHYTSSPAPSTYMLHVVAKDIYFHISGYSSERGILYASVFLVFFTCVMLIFCLMPSVNTVVTLHGHIKEAARTLRKQDPTFPENCALNRCKVHFNLVWNLQLTQHKFACTWTVQDTWSITIRHGIYGEAAKKQSGLHTTCTVLKRGTCKFVNSAFWTLFHLDHLFLSLAQRTAML